MPGMTGLQLMGRIRGNWPDCRVIFLTGYSEFEYVYTAIRQEGVGYLLKTEDDTVILDAVACVAEEVEAARKAEQERQLLTSALEQARPHLRREYLLHCLVGDRAEEGASKQETGDTGKPDPGLQVMAGQPVYLLSGRLDSLFAARGGCLADPRLDLLKVGVAQWFDGQFLVEGLVGEQQEVLWLLQPRGSLDAVPAVLESALESLQAHVRQEMDTTVSFAYLTSPYPWPQLPDGYALIQRLFHRMTGLGREVVLNERTLVHASRDWDAENEAGCLSSENRRRSLIESYTLLLERGEEVSCLDALREVTMGLSACKSGHDPYAMEIYFLVATTLLTFMNRHRLQRQVSFQMGMAPLTRVDLHENWDEASRYLEDMTRCLCALSRGQGQELVQSSIQSVCTHIHEHMHEDLSLLKLAEISWFNPSYLSRLFRQTTGQTLSEYIAQARLAKARELLQDPGVRILDVSAAVGFESSHYFARFFRKMTGLSPMEFRERCRSAPTDASRNR
jgi:two-component system, response regulator YesN